MNKSKNLIMKEDSSIEDSIYKTNKLQTLNKTYKYIAFFENEPVILNKVSKELPQIHLFWVDSTHSRKELPPKSAIPLSMNYKLSQP